MKCDKCSIPILDEDLVILKEIEKFGNLRNFQKITLKKKDQIFLDGAVKITNSTRSKFKIRGRICRSTDFDRIIGLLKKEEMV